LLSAIPALDLNRTAAPDDRWIGNWSYQFGRQEVAIEIKRGDDGHLYSTDAAVESEPALIPLADGGYIEPMYYGLCHMAADNRDLIVCGRLMKGGFTLELHRRK